MGQPVEYHCPIFLDFSGNNFFESNNSVSYNPYFNPYYYSIILCLKNSRFIAALPMIDESLIAVPERNPFTTRFFDRKKLTRNCF